MKINRNIFWTDNFLDRLINLGVRYICISPGSRNTPLTVAAAANNKLKCFVHIDERSSGFFALGLAKASGKAVAVVTTSGTASAELYPAIIEAYQQRIPLIICTADRPPELLGKGANQTINQDNIYKNHIRFYKNAGLPSVSFAGFKRIRKLAEKAYLKSNEGPVHINFPFRKPFEPESYTDEIGYQELKLIESFKSREISPPVSKIRTDKNLYNEILKSITRTDRGLILAGPMKYNRSGKKKILHLAERLNYPVIADACSQLRFGTRSEHVITNYETFLRNDDFIYSSVPDLIIQFGRTPSSRAIEIFLGKIKTKRYIINEYGDIFDPWNTASGIFKCPPSLFSDMISKDIHIGNKSEGKDWLNKFIKADIISRREQNRIINRSSFQNDCRIIVEVLNNLPENTHIMISNSMPVRDLDYFTQKTSKNIIVHSNRGASGIDGIVSTSLGIMKEVKEPVILITGDMAFYYDLNALLTAEKYKIPLVIILINNNGGGIFGMLPISRYGRIYKEYFVSPHKLEFGNIVRSFGGKHKMIRNWTDLGRSLNYAIKDTRFTVLEIKTDIRTSVSLRKKYIKGTGKIISRNSHEN